MAQSSCSGVFEANTSMNLSDCSPVLKAKKDFLSIQQKKMS
jgi:hypothetical protein